MDGQVDPGMEERLGRLVQEYGYNPRAWIGPLLIAIGVGLAGLYCISMGIASIATGKFPLKQPNPNATKFGTALILGGALAGALGYGYYRYWLATRKDYGLRLFELGFSQKFSRTRHVCLWDEITKVRYIVKGGPVMGSLMETPIIGLEIHRRDARPLGLDIMRLDHTVFKEIVERFKENTASLASAPGWEKGFSFDLKAQ